MRSLQGRVLGGRYRLAQYLAEGNFGAVFRSEQLFLGTPIRRVAVKVSKRKDIPEDKARELFADVFVLAQALDGMRDAVARSRLVHVYDAGIAEENRGFVVMEFIEGHTLADEIERSVRAGVQQTLRWTRQIAEAIAGLHELPEPVIHRDLKPDNVLIGPDHALRVVDFGLTARLNGLGWVPGVAGTTTYMAPETARGRSLPASDIYSIGLIMYEALTGRLPFDELAPPIGMAPDKHSDWLTAQKEQMVVVPPSAKNATVPAGLDALVLKCLAFDPRRRVANGRALLRELDLVEKPSGLPPGQAALDRGNQLKQTGNLKGACDEWAAGVEEQGVRLAVLATLLRQLACAKEELGDKPQAAKHWLELWDKVKDSGAVMASTQERVELLDRNIKLQTELNNSFQIQRFQRERSRYPALV